MAILVIVCFTIETLEEEIGEYAVTSTPLLTFSWENCLSSDALITAMPSPTLERFWMPELMGLILMPLFGTSGDVERLSDAARVASIRDRHNLPCLNKTFKELFQYPTSGIRLWPRRHIGHHRARGKDFEGNRRIGDCHCPAKYIMTVSSSSACPNQLKRAFLIFCAVA